MGEVCCSGIQKGQEQICKEQSLNEQMTMERKAKSRDHTVSTIMPAYSFNPNRAPRAGHAANHSSTAILKPPRFSHVPRKDQTAAPHLGQTSEPSVPSTGQPIPADQPIVKQPTAIVSPKTPLFPIPTGQPQDRLLKTAKMACEDSLKLNLGPAVFIRERTGVPSTERYETICYIDRGAFGEVNKVLDKHTREFRAIKAFSKEQCQMTDRFADEIQILRSLVRFSQYMVLEPPERGEAL